jgi:hypothetical protein
MSLRSARRAEGRGSGPHPVEQLRRCVRPIPGPRRGRRAVPAPAGAAVAPAVAAVRVRVRGDREVLPLAAPAPTARQPACTGLTAPSARTHTLRAARGAVGHPGAARLAAARASAARKRVLSSGQSTALPRARRAGVSARGRWRARICVPDTRVLDARVCRTSPPATIHDRAHGNGRGGRVRGARGLATRGARGAARPITLALAARLRKPAAAQRRGGGGRGQGWEEGDRAVRLGEQRKCAPGTPAEAPSAASVPGEHRLHPRPRHRPRRPLRAPRLPPPRPRPRSATPLFSPRAHRLRRPRAASTSAVHHCPGARHRLPLFRPLRCPPARIRGPAASPRSPWSRRTPKRRPRCGTLPRPPRRQRHRPSWHPRWLSYGRSPAARDKRPVGGGASGAQLLSSRSRCGEQRGGPRRSGPRRGWKTSSRLLARGWDGAGASQTRGSEEDAAPRPHTSDPLRPEVVVDCDRTGAHLIALRRARLSYFRVRNSELVTVAAGARLSPLRCRRSTC